jgi:integrase
MYRPDSHKLEHHGKERVIAIGPTGQKVLSEFLPLQGTEEPVFAVPGTARPYRRDSYTNAIRRGCEAAGVPIWGPNRLRHNFATLARKEFGIEAARVTLGHSSAATSEIYAERDLEQARAVVAKIG